MADNRLNIASSGGGGHLQAILAYIANTLKIDPDVTFLLHRPIQRQRQDIDAFIQFGSGLANGNLKAWLSWLGKFIPIPLLPSQQEIKRGIAALEEKNQQARPYVDMLLDVFPRGYESVAIWNCLHRRDATGELGKLLKLQFFNDFIDYRTVKQFFYDELITKALNGTPYTSVTSTQPIALGALCDAVIAYNHWALRNRFQPVYIDQFMTDLPTDGASNFFKPFSGLTSCQAAVMRVHAVGIDYNIFENNLTNFRCFLAFVDIEPRYNPMVRPEFTDSQNDKSECWDKDCTVEILNEDSGITEMLIPANQAVASIMLNSQANLSTINYVKALVEQGYRVFVFGGKKLITELDELEVTPQQRQWIIPLVNQDALQITQIKTRSHIVIDKCGGLTTMEEWAMPHHSLQLILIHHADNLLNCFTSGLTWEDGNADKLIDALGQMGITVEKTMPKLARISISHYHGLVKLKSLELNDARQPPNNFNCSFQALVKRAYANRVAVNPLFNSLDDWYGSLTLELSTAKGKKALTQYTCALFYYGILQFHFVGLAEYLQSKQRSRLLHNLLTFLLINHDDISVLLLSNSGDEFSSQRMCTFIQLLMIKFEWRTGVLGFGFFGGDKIKFGVGSSHPFSIRIPKNITSIFEAFERANEKAKPANAVGAELIWQEALKQVLDLIKNQAEDTLSSQAIRRLAP